jgi:antitoxin HicB
MSKKNPHIGSSFENWLDQEGIREEATSAASKAIHALTDEERAAIAEARRGKFASAQDVAAFWKQHGIKDSSKS